LLLESLDWNIDTHTLISYLSVIPESYKLKYLMISLIMLCDVKYDVFSVQYTHKIIMILLKCMNNNKIVNIENKHQTFHIINEIIISLCNMKENNFMEGELIKTYFELIGISNFCELVSEINMKKIKKYFDIHN